jgi:hypothetical protein
MTDIFALIDLGFELLEREPATVAGQQRMAADLRLLADLAQVDVLRLAAAAATPGIERLIAAGLDLGITEAEAHSAIAFPKGVAIWCRKVQHAAVRQGLAPAGCQ